MSVHATEWSMVSDISPESAYREIGSGAAVWQLSWLPGRPLTREQALAGMELDELLSNLDSVHDGHAQVHAAMLAGTVGIIWEHAVILLFKRILARLQGCPAAPQGGTDPADGNAQSAPRPHRRSRHAHSSPSVFR
ncbi:hypothetical protein [Nocardia suismassiliense]|uniref:hypothetical protein n=1 Tax=Nocardia suismassiliense TaxID=2077092 RepID=UPI0018FE2901|nr:hypothetical protein [Nocardia suismassiliense]